MSEQQKAAAVIPEWDTADRMRKALRVCGLSPGTMAEFLGVGGNTVSTWINGRIEPSAQTLRLWAMTTGVSYKWLCHGSDGPHPQSQTVSEPSRKDTNYMQCLTPGIAA